MIGPPARTRGYVLSISTSRELPGRELGAILPGFLGITAYRPSPRSERPLNFHSRAFVLPQFRVLTASKIKTPRTLSKAVAVSPPPKSAQQRA